jgi:hypothetical protein
MIRAAVVVLNHPPSCLDCSAHCVPRENARQSCGARASPADDAEPAHVLRREMGAALRFGGVTAPEEEEEGEREEGQQ